MADTKTVIQISENTPEGVAYKLLELVAVAEGKKLQSGAPSADRDWILSTYAQCLQAVTRPFDGPLFWK